MSRAVLCAWLALSCAGGAQAQALSAQQARAANLLLLEVRLDQHLLSDSLTAFQYGNDVYLPLGDLSRLLTIAITTQPVEGRASGFILNEQRSFSLNVLERQAAVAGREETLDRAQFKLQPDDIYVSSRLLARWLPVDLDVDMSSLLLRVRPREQLPLQARLARSGRAPAGQAGAAADPGYPRQATPYALAGVPALDQTFGLEARRGGKPEASYTGYLTTDLLGLQAALYASAGPRIQGGRDLRLTLGRNDPDAGLLGPLHARSALVGSVPVPGVSGVSFGSPTGDGLALGNRPLNQPTRFDRHTLQGDLPPGWDVELYFNDALVAFQGARPDGKYVFEDQPLVYGSNEFRLVFHGPLGQVRVERQNFLLEQSLVAPGQLYYNAAAHRDVFGHQRGMAQFDLGLPGGLTASAGYTRTPLLGLDERYVNLALRQYWNSFIVGLDAVRAGNGGALAHAELKTRIGGLALSLGHSALRDFSSEIYLPSIDAIRARDELRADGLLPAVAGTILPVSLQVRRDRRESGNDNLEVQGRISAYRGGTALSNALRWQSLRDFKSADGVFQLSRWVAGVGVTGQLQYTLQPTRALSSLALAADKVLAEGYQLNLGLLRSFVNRQYDFSAALNKSLGSFGLGVSAHYSTDGDYGAGLQLFVALGREPRSSAWHMDAQPLAATGAASVRVFLDKNLNGIPDAADEPVRNAGFTVNGGTQLARTDAAGIAWLSRLPPDQHVDIALDSTTLEDPQWMPRRAGVRLVPRPGKVAELDFPVIVTGEIDGTTWLVANGAKRGIGDLELELVDSQRKVVARATSANDGYFVLSNVAPGDYLLRVARAQLARLHMHDLGMHLVTIGPDGSFVNGRELYVENDSATAAPATVAP
ncbi:MAG: hypothetical protein ACJ8LG_02945 [Massilia sp.]